MDDIANFIPARLAWFFLVIASFILRYDGRASWQIGLRDRKNHTSPNCAYPEGAVAGALGITLGGTHEYFGETVIKPTIEVEINPFQKKKLAKRFICYIRLQRSLLSFLQVFIYYYFKGVAR